MTNRPNRKAAAVLNRLMPVLWDDNYFVAFHKPPRIDFDGSVRKFGPSIIQVITHTAQISDIELQPGGEALIPLVLPERSASGLALFAKSPEAARRFSGMAATDKLLFVHSAVVKGKPARTKMAIKPSTQNRKRNPEARKPKTTPSKLPSAKIEIVESLNEYHIARCSSRTAGFDDLRRCFRAAGNLTIAGDVRPNPYAPERAQRPARRPMIHLEQLQFPHPFEQKAVSISDPSPRAFNAFLATRRPIEEHLQTALTRRIEQIIDPNTDCYRLFTGRAEGYSGLIADKLGDVVVIEMQQGKFEGGEPVIRQVANWYAKILGIKTVYGRVAPVTRSGGTEANSRIGKVELIKGEAVDEITVTENSVKLIVKPAAGLSFGLFMDHRENRKRIAGLAKGKNLLNLFAYTCGFGAVAAARGADTTTNVDLTAGNLEWGKLNYGLNNIDLSTHTFIRSDVFEYFKRATRQGRMFDVIVIDPPSFARTKKPKGTFQIKRDLVKVIREAMPLLAGGGHMLIATNNRQLPLDFLAEQVKLAAQKRAFRIVAKPKLPADFAPDPALQKAIVVRFS